jgi:hypothetical protein
MANYAQFLVPLPSLKERFREQAGATTNASPSISLNEVKAGQSCDATIFESFANVHDGASS